VKADIGVELSQSCLMITFNLRVGLYVTDSLEFETACSSMKTAPAAAPHTGKRIEKFLKSGFSLTISALSRLYS
jgi:hypothetical protein